MAITLSQSMTSQLPTSASQEVLARSTQSAATYDTAQVLGYENRFNPVTEYLNRVANTIEPCPYFDRLATELLGTSTEDIQNPAMSGDIRLADLILKRFLVGAVARIRNPGCVHDWMPILIGGQNSGKSTFFQYLTPPDARTPQVLIHGFQLFNKGSTTSKTDPTRCMQAGSSFLMRQKATSAGGTLRR
jgi:hypothetical protein